MNPTQKQTIFSKLPAMQYRLKQSGRGPAGANATGEARMAINDDNGVPTLRRRRRGGPSVANAALGRLGEGP